jgi:hypothetical protein
LPAQYGVVTPASALGPAFTQRFEHIGIEWRTLDAAPIEVAAVRAHVTQSASGA